MWRWDHTTPAPYLANDTSWCVGAIALAEVLAEHRFLLSLDLKENDIRVAGLMALQLAHKMNQTLLNLDIPRNSRVDAVRFWLAHLITSSPLLITLSPPSSPYHFLIITLSPPSSSPYHLPPHHLITFLLITSSLLSPPAWSSYDQRHVRRDW